MPLQVLRAGLWSTLVQTTLKDNIMGIVYRRRSYLPFAKSMNYCTASQIIVFLVVGIQHRSLKCFCRFSYALLLPSQWTIHLTGSSYLWLVQLLLVRPCSNFLSRWCSACYLACYCMDSSSQCSHPAYIWSMWLLRVLDFSHGEAEYIKRIKAFLTATFAVSPGGVSWPSCVNPHKPRSIKTSFMSYFHDW